MNSHNQNDPLTIQDCFQAIPKKVWQLQTTNTFKPAQGRCCCHGRNVAHQAKAGPQDSKEDHPPVKRFRKAL